MAHSCSDNREPTVLVWLQVMTIPVEDDGEQREDVTPTHFTAGKVFTKY